jgi:predicted RNA-binding protein
MCLDYGPFKLVSGDEETSLENVASLLIQQDSVKLIDNFGKTELVSGRVSEIDLLNQRIVLT